MSPKAVVQHADTRPELDWCQACQSYAWRDLGHVCPVRDERRARLVLLAAAGFVVVFWVLVVAGIKHWPHG